MLRIHNTKRTRMWRLSDRPDQKIARKPDGLWWGLGMGWLDYVDANRPQRRQNQKCNFTVSLADDANILRLCSQDDVLAFTTQFGAQYEWQAERNPIDPAKAVAEPHCSGKSTRIIVPAIDWGNVARIYDGIEIARYPLCKDNLSIEWLDIDWCVASGCAWRASSVQLDGPFSLDEIQEMALADEAPSADEEPMMPSP